MRSPNLIVTVNQKEITDAMKSITNPLEPEQLWTIITAQRRTIKGLRKRLSKSRIQFNHIMAETRETPSWYYESDIEYLSESDFLKAKT